MQKLAIVTGGSTGIGRHLVQALSDAGYAVAFNYKSSVDEALSLVEMIEQDGCYVYRLDTQTNALTIVADDFDKPNGLAFSPDEKILYISDTGNTHNEACPKHIRQFDVVDGKSLTNGSVFTNIEDGLSDGFRLDANGNVWTSAGKSVQCFAPNGDLIGEIPIGELVANLEFGGPDGNRLFITASTSLYAIYVGVKGAKY